MGEMHRPWFEDECQSETDDLDVFRFSVARDEQPFPKLV